ncbi:hypothetical protein CLAFUW4_03340 [Fulvia fulva]|nr:hypothetical protein CLAFUR4_03329 [Fulvia fulva]WPV11304.1 hypothetical protein CLAFUW4_03340 [Fulvia fulva]WPV26248.1 hypothetical protein CLAFUW7_03332 [Fulvia fulva]
MCCRCATFSFSMYTQTSLPRPFLQSHPGTAIKMAATVGASPDLKMQGFGPDCAVASENAPAPAVAADKADTKPKTGRPRKRPLSPPHSSSSWQASDSQPAPKRGRGRPRIHPLHHTIEVRARQKRADIADGDMTARDGARAAVRHTARQPRSMSDPYKVLGLKCCETDPALIHAAYIKAQMSCGDMLPGPLQLSDDPDSAGHQRLTMVSDANVILESRRMKTLLDKCLNHHYKKHTASAIDILDIAISLVRSPPTEQEVEQAYIDRMAEWSGLEKVAGVVIRMFKAARETVLRDLKQAQEEQEKQSRRALVERRDSVMSDADALGDEVGEL